MATINSVALVLCLNLVGTLAEARSIFLNGKDISSARSQDLKGVAIHIDENGDLFVTAPNYQVNEEDTYIPLSKYVQGVQVPKKEAAQQLPDSHAKVGTTDSLKLPPTSTVVQTPPLVSPSATSKPEDKPVSKVPPTATGPGTSDAPIAR